jgi:hypothetical protein
MGETNAGGADGTAPSNVRAWLDIVSIAVDVTCGAQRRRDISNRSGGHDLCPRRRQFRSAGFVLLRSHRSPRAFAATAVRPAASKGQSIVARQRIHNCNEISSSRCACYINVFNIVVKGAFCTHLLSLAGDRGPCTVQWTRLRV